MSFICMRMRKSFSHLKWFALNLDLKQRLGYLGNCLIPRAFLGAVETIAGKLLCYNIMVVLFLVVLFIMMFHVTW